MYIYIHVHAHSEQLGFWMTRTLENVSVLPAAVEEMLEQAAAWKWEREKLFTNFIKNMYIRWIKN